MSARYRMLRGCDIIRKGDQWWCDEDLAWFDTVESGNRVASTLPNFYRRPIAQASTKLGKPATITQQVSCHRRCRPYY